jgi:hypothetical protein
LAEEKAKELEERLAKREARNKIWNTLQQGLQSHHQPAAPPRFVDVSLWEPDHEEGRWLAWQLQLLNKKLRSREQQIRKLRKQNQRLARQAQKLQKIEGSRTWNLVKKLDHLRARVSGR